MVGWEAKINSQLFLGENSIYWEGDLSEPFNTILNIKGDLGYKTRVSF